MHQHDLAPWRAGGLLSLDKHLHIGLRAVKLLLDGESPRAGWPGPEAPGYGLHVRVLEEGHEGLQASLSREPRRAPSPPTLSALGQRSALASREDSDVAEEVLRLLQQDGIEVLLETGVLDVEGSSGQQIGMHVRDPRGTRVLQATDILVATEVAAR